MFKFKKKCEKSNKEVLIDGLVEYECSRRGIDIGPLNLTMAQKEELYRQFQMYKRMKK